MMIYVYNRNIVADCVQFDVWNDRATRQLSDEDGADKSVVSAVRAHFGQMAFWGVSWLRFTNSIQQTLVAAQVVNRPTDR